MSRKKVDIADKKLHLQFVYLSDEEYSSLCEILGPDGAADWIEELNIYLGKSEANRRKYDSHYWAIRSWARRAGKTKGDGRGTIDEGRSAADRVIALLKDPTAYMPEDPKIRPALHAMLVLRKMNWPQLRILLKEGGPEAEARIRAEFLKHYKA